VSACCHSLLFAACLLSACSGPYSQSKVSAKAGRPEIPVSVVPVAETAIPEVVSATGELFAEEQTTVSAKVPGRVARMLVDLGSAVRAGDILAEIEKTDYEFRLRQADAMVQQTRARLGLTSPSGDEVTPEETAIVRNADAALKEARFIFETTERLHNEGVVSRIEFEKAQVRRQGIEAQYQAALEEVAQLRAQLTERRAQLELAQQQLSDCTIRAPFAGAITQRQASLGEYLAVNAPVVVLVRQHPLRLRLEVPERYASKIRAGQQIDVRLEGSQAARTGRVVRLSPALDAQSRSLLIEGEIPNADGRLRPGSFAEATLIVDAAARGIAIPFRSIISFAGVERAWVVENGKLAERLLETGRRLPDEKVEVLDGLRAGERLVLNANDRMTPGQRVDIK
jgi:RND family efflux transporter MFP subunit